MRAPSAKTLTSTFRLPSEAVKLIRKFADAADDGERLKELVDAWAPATASYVRSMHSDPYRSKLWRTTVALHAINEHLGTYGVEGLGPPRSGDYAPPFEYLNAGDPYSATLIYDRDKDRLFVGSWGDVAAKHPKWEGSENHAKKKKPPTQLQREIDEVLARPSQGRGGSFHGSMSDDEKIRAAIARFPPTFGLRGFPGDVFRLSPTSSYVSGGRVMLYTQRKDGNQWLDFAKETEPDLRREVISKQGESAHATRGPSTKKSKARIVNVEAATPAGYRWLKSNARGATVTPEGFFAVTDEHEWAQSLNAAGAIEIK